jgi:sucrose-6-phosphate hydrolase SacC (GH32 family)
MAPEGRPVVVADFEGGSYSGWAATGDAFGSAPAAGSIGTQQAVDGFQGKGLVNTFRNGDASTGTLTSPEFQIDRKHLSFLVGGGYKPETLAVNLRVGGAVVRTATGADAERLSWRSWDVSEFQGKAARLEIVDNATGGWGHLNADQFVLSDTPARNPQEGALWADYGSDFYAGVTWSDVPARDRRTLWIGWMSNWTYANDVPTSPWRSAMSIPRVLRLRDTPDGWRLLQKPVHEIQRQLDSPDRLRRSVPAKVNEWFASRRFSSGVVDLELTVDWVPPTGSMTLECRHGTNAVTRVIADFGRAELRIDRTASGRSDFSPTFAAVHRAPLRIVRGEMNLRAILDTSSIEVFAQDGETVMTDLILPPTPELSFALKTEGRGSECRIATLTVGPLKSATARLQPTRQ